MGAVCLVVLAGCGRGSSEVSRSELRSSLATRYDLSPKQTSCMADYLAKRYSAEVLAAIADHGLMDVPVGQRIVIGDIIVVCDLYADPDLAPAAP